MKKILLDKEPYDGDLRVFCKSSVTIRPGVTVLTGCNGIGKTTLMNYIENNLREDKIVYRKFDNIKNGGHNAMQWFLERQAHELLFSFASSSEGERIMLAVGNMAAGLRKTISVDVKQSKHNEFWMLLDATDSGLSIDNIIELKDLFGLVQEDCAKLGVECYIVISANEYELAAGEQCLDVATLRYKKYKTYNSYKKAVLKSADIKKKRFEDE